MDQPGPRPCFLLADKGKYRQQLRQWLVRRDPGPDNVFYGETIGLELGRYIRVSLKRGPDRSHFRGSRATPRAAAFRTSPLLWPRWDSGKGLLPSTLD